MSGRKVGRKEGRGEGRMNEWENGWKSECNTLLAGIIYRLFKCTLSYKSHTNLQTNFREYKTLTCICMTILQKLSKKSEFMNTFLSMTHYCVRRKTINCLILTIKENFSFILHCFFSFGLV